MPDFVQQDLVAQLQSSLETAKSPLIRRSILYELALCAFAGVGVEDDCASKALAWLSEAAQLRSPQALAIVFRLYRAFQKEIPHELSAITDPIKELEDQLACLESRNGCSSYFAERVRRFEQLFQQEALNQPYDVLFHGKIIASSVRLDCVESVLSAQEGLGVENLECVSRQTDGDGDTTVFGGLLISVAARLGLLSLIRFLFSTVSEKPHVDNVSPAGDGNLLTAACRGGHFDVLEFLVSQGSDAAHHQFHQVGTAMHWLIMFPDDKIENALSLLLGTPGGEACLQVSVPAPGIPLNFQHSLLRGTPLEFAVIVNHVPLVELILRQVDDGGNNLTKIGWTADTLRLAAISHLSRLLPRLAALEQAHRRAQPTFAAQARLDRSQGRPEIRAVGLFYVAQAPPDPIRLLLIHGAQSRAELESSIWRLTLEKRLSSISDEDEHGSTPLTYAVRSAHCNLNTDLISILLNHAAEFGAQETPKWIVLNVLSKRRSRDAEVITKLLLEFNLIPHAAPFLTVAIASGNTGILTAMLGFTGRDTRLDARTPHVEGDESVSLLFYALTVPGCAAMLRVLLDGGADPASLLPNEWTTPLEVLLVQPECDVEAINLLIERGAPLILNDGLTILHRAALKGGEVSRVHVLVHILRNERVRALVNHPAPVELVSPLAMITISDLELMQPMAPLTMACLAAKPGAVEALLQAGADVRLGVIAEEPSSKNRYPLPEALATARRVGRHPEKSPLFDHKKLRDEEALYRWRLNIEQVMLALLNWADPGHGRTQLHIAAELGHYARVVELVERRGFRVFVADRHNQTPMAYLEDVRVPDSDLDDLHPSFAEPYVENVRRLKHYLTLKLVEELCSDMDNPDALRSYLADSAASASEDEENKMARIELEAQLRLLDLDRDAVTMGDGYDSPAELVKKLSDLLKVQKETLGDVDPKTLRTMRRLGEAYCRLGRFDEAEKLQVLALEGMEVQLPAGDEELFRAYAERTNTLCGQGRLEVALQYLEPLSIQAYDRLGNKHVVTLGLVDVCAAIRSMLGDLEGAIRQSELSLDVYRSIIAETPLDDNPDIPVAILNVKGSLVADYCKLGNFAAARKLVGEAGTTRNALGSAKADKFFYVFDALLNGTATPLDLHGQDDVAEQMYSEIVEACLHRHKKRKSHCTRTAFERLASFYLRRRQPAKRSTTLQKLVDILASTLGPEHPDTVRAMASLASSLVTQLMWDEASLLQERVIRSLEKEQPRDDDELLKTKLALSRSLGQLGQAERAEKFGREAVLGLTALYGDDAETTVDAETSFSIQLLALGGGDRLAEATAIQRRHVDRSVRLYGELNEKTRKAVNELVGVLIPQDQLREAEKQARRCLRICEGLPNTDHQSMARALFLLGASLETEAGTNKREQQDLYRRSIAQEKLANGGKHSVSSLGRLKSLAKCHMSAEEFDQAEPLLHEIIAEAPGAHRGNKDTQIALDAMTFLGYIARKSGANEDAISHYDAAAALSRRIHGDSAPETARLLNNLIHVYNEMGDRAWDAYQASLEVLRYRRETFGEYHEETRDIKVCITGLCGELDMWPEAERIDRDLLRQYEHLEQEQEVAAWYIVSVSVSCRKQGASRCEEAEHFARKALNFWRGRDNKKEVVASMMVLAEALAEAGGEPEKLSEAEQLAKESYEAASSLVEDDETDPEDIKVDAQALLAYVYHQQGRLAEAEEVQLRVVGHRPDSDEDFYLDDVKHVRALFATYVAMGRYEDSVTLGRKALDKAKRALGSEDDEEDDSYLEDMRLLWWVLVDLAEVLGTHLGRWQEARQMGNLALKWISKCSVGDHFEENRVWLAALRAVRPIREKLSLNKSLLETDVTVSYRLFHERLNPC